MAWIHLTQNCQVVGLDGNVLTLGFANAGARDSFESSGCSEVVHQAAIDVVGADWKIETIVDPGAQPEGAPTVTKAATDPAPRRPGGRHRGRPRGHAGAGDARRHLPPGRPTRSRRTRAPTRAPPRPRPARRSSRPGPGCRGAAPDDLAAADAEASRDDLDADPDNLGGEDLLARELGASMIEEIKHSMTHPRAR